ncbi:hypothetical protein [Thermococcus sp. MV11]|uniref:hypothetical protein n=1 Tax=Thermococcus sp. MV11 TaxID=1638267 RepID=UPI0014315998|nr:hypothetical protein [Thermococcus sp. MV11]NJE03841.1 hypothetical protein [Thermococcus sp. MV11]
MGDKVNSSLKLLLIVGFISLEALILSLYTHPANGYEYSIYAYLSKSEYVLIGIIVSVFLLALYFLNPDLKIECPACSIFTIIVGITLYSLHIIRGYFIWNGMGDPASHIAYAKFIVEYGRVWTGNSGYLYYRADYYPMLHVFHATLSLISDINLISISNWLPTYFWIFYLVFLYLTSKTLLAKNGFQLVYQLLVLFMLLVPINKWYLNLTPNASYNLTWFLITLYILTRAKNHKYMLLLLMILIAAQLWHPLAFVVGVILLVAFYLSSNSTDNKVPIYIVGMMGIIFVIWMFQFWPGVLFIKSLYTLFAGGGHITTPATSLSHNLNLVNSYGYNPLLTLLKLWGLQLSIVMLAGISLVLRIIKCRNPLKVILEGSGILRAFVLIGSIMVGLFVIPVGFSPLRLFYYLLVFSLLILIVEERSTIHKLLSRKRTKTLIVIGLALMFIAGFITLYPSPYTLTPNLQTTKSELTGVMWFVEKFNKTYMISGTYNLPLGRYALLILNPYQIESLGSPFTKWYLPRSDALPPHFGYPNHTTLCWYYPKEPAYIFITSFDKMKYEKVLPKLQKFWYYPWDFNRLNVDSGIDRIYTSNDISIFVTVCGREV